MDAFQKFANHGRNKKIETSKIFKALETGEVDVLVNTINVEEVRSLSKTWDVIISLSNLLELFQYLKKNDIENATIDDVIQSEANLEEQFKVNIY